MSTAPTILIVEDSESKRHSIQAVVEREFPSVVVLGALSVRSAINQLESMELDMIIADMSLPTYDIETRERGGTPRPFGGIEVFETLERYERVVPVLVVTSYPAIVDGSQSVGLSDLSRRLKEDFPDQFLGTVYFDPAYSNWEREISMHLHQVLKGKYGS